MENCVCSRLNNNKRSDAMLTNTWVNCDTNNSNIRFVPTIIGHNKISKQSAMTRIFENIYDTCIGYNIRYCGFNVFYRRDKIFKHAFKDWIVLLCFLITSSVVFLTLLARMAYHSCALLGILFSHIKRFMTAPLTSDIEGPQKEDLFIKYSQISDL